MTAAVISILAMAEFALRGSRPPFSCTCAGGQCTQGTGRGAPRIANVPQERSASAVKPAIAATSCLQVSSVFRGSAVTRNFSLRRLITALDACRTPKLQETPDPAVTNENHPLRPAIRLGTRSVLWLAKFLARLEVRCREPVQDLSGGDQEGSGTVNFLTEKIKDVLLHRRGNFFDRNGLRGR